MLHSAFTYYTGFKVNSGEYKLMGLAPYGEPRYAAVIRDKLNVIRSAIPAVIHVDFSARIQTVHRETNPRFYALLEAFKAQTGCPVLVNTSFNVRGAPVVCTPEDVFRCFMSPNIETLVISNCMLHKEQQDLGLKLDYKEAFELD